MIWGLGILKLAVLTSLFYVAIAFLIEFGLFLYAYIKGSVAVVAARGTWWFFFALLWAIAFGLAWHYAPMGPKHPPKL